MKRATKLIGSMAAIALIACSGSNSSSEASPEAPQSIEELQSEMPETETAETKLTSGNLAGLYLDAGDEAPVMLMVPGSGPTDLDGNNPLGVNAQPFKLLAESLADRGISTVRVNKRGMYSSAAAGNPNQVSVEIYVEDYRGWIDTIKSETGQACVYLMGHSEGALMVTAAAEARDDVCGLILVSGIGRTLGDVLRSQLKANPANLPILEQAFSAIDALEAGQSVDSSALHPGLRPLFAEPVQGFLISVMSVDPAEVAQRANQRTLVIQGETDVQTSVEDAKLLAAATGTEAVILPGVNHVLKVATVAETSASYADPDLPIAKGVVDAISEFILSED